MSRFSSVTSRLGLAPWIVAGVLLLGAGAPAAAQDATPEPIEVAASDSETAAELPAATTDSGGGGTPPPAMPSTGVGSGLAPGGTGPLGLGALVGAFVAGAAALWGRFRRG